MRHPEIEEFVVDTGRLRTHVRAAGSEGAPAVLLLHGNVASSRYYEGLMGALSPAWRLVAPDLRGYGLSAVAPVDATNGLGDFSQDVLSLVAALGLEEDNPLHVIGWSLGGGVAMQLAMDAPEKIASLTLLAPMSPFGFGGTRSVDGRPHWEDFAGSGGGTANPDLVARLAGGDRSAEAPTSPRAVMHALYVHSASAILAEDEEDYVDGMLQTAIGDHNYPGDSRPSPNWPFVAPGTHGVVNAISPAYCNLAGFAEIGPRPPVLWIRGEDDMIVSDHSFSELGHLGSLGLVPGWPGEEAYPAQPMVSQTRYVLDRYRQAGGTYREEVFASCGHSPHIEHPGEVAQLIQAFLRTS
ncbi:MAG: alpha/beta hydrolase [Actinomycetota bacterium]|nr:alpha/beta hydrolase [Actinomycetota bacterium]